MKKMLVLSAAVLAASSASAAPKCDVPEEKWLSETYFEAELQAQGYKIDSLQIGPSKCFELTGEDKNGNKVLVYFDPETGAPVGGK